MALNILKTTRRFMWPYVVSVGLHTSLVAGLLYASINRIYPSTAIEHPMSVTLVAPAPQPAVAPALPTPLQPTVPPQPVPTPEPQPVPVVEPPAPVQLSKPRPKPRPVIKREEKLRPHKEPAAVEQPPSDVPLREKPVRSATPPASAPAAAPADSGPVAIRRDNPVYSDRARALGVEGRVQILFDVNSDGQVENVRIISATPANMFERDIREASRRWRYQSGKPGKNIPLTIFFELKGVRSGD